MKKKIISLSLCFLMILMFVFVVASCNSSSGGSDTPSADLTSDIASAKAELEELYHKEDYYDVELEMIEEKISSSKSSIDNAKTKKEIDDLVASFKSFLKTVLTKEEVDKKYPPLKVRLVRNSFVAGQYLEYTDLIVSVLKDDRRYERTEDFSFDLEGIELDESIDNVTVSYQGHELSLPIVVKTSAESVVGIEAIVENNLIYYDGLDLSEVVLYRYQYADQSYSDYFNIEKEWASIIQKEGIMELTLTVNAFDKEFVTTVEFENPEVKHEITYPNKTSYVVGETLDLTGCQIEIEYAYGVGKVIPVSMEMVDLSMVDFSKPGNYPLTVNEDSVRHYDILIKVREKAKSIEIVKELTDNCFDLSDNLTSVASRFEEKCLKVVYENSEEFLNIDDSMLSVDKFSYGKNEVTVKFQDLTTTFEIEVELYGTSVKEVYALANGTIVDVTGIFVGYNTPGNATAALTNTELILKDPDSNDLLVVTGLGRDYKVGDVLELRGKVVLGTTTDSSRVSVAYMENLLVRTHLDDPKLTELNLDEAILVTNEDDFRSYFLADKRDDAFNKVYQLHANLTGLKAYNELYRIYFPGPSSLAEQYVDTNLSPVIKIESTKLNTSYDLHELFKNNENWAGDVCGKDIYVVYLGSSGVYYADFVILGDYCIKEPEKIVKSLSVKEEVDTRINVGSDLGLIGKHILINYWYGSDEVEITKDNIVLPADFDINVSGNYEIKVVYNDQEVLKYTLSIQDNSAKSIELVNNILDKDYLIGDLEGIAAGFSENSLKVTKEDDSVEFTNITAEMLEVVKWDLGQSTIKLYYGVKELEFNCKTILPAKSVSEVYELANGTEVEVSGIFVGYNTPGNASAAKTNTEVIIKDPTNNNVLVLTGLARDYTVGDLITAHGSVVIGSSTDTTRMAVKTISDSVVVHGRTLKNENIQMDLSKAITFANQDDFIDAFKNHRNDYVNKLIRLHGNLSGIQAYETLYRIYFPGANSLATQYIDKNLSPVIKYEATQLNSNIDVHELFHNNTEWAVNPTDKDVYVVYLGSSGVYYGDFVILGDYCVKDVELIVKSRSIVENLPDNIQTGADPMIIGSHILEEYAYGESKQIEITQEMVTSTPTLDPNVAGEYAIKITYLGEVIKEYTLTVSSKEVISLELVNAIEDGVYGFEDFASLALGFSAGSLKVTYSGDVEYLDVKDSMISHEGEYVLGENNFTLSLGGKSTVFAAKCSFAGKSITELKDLEAGTEVKTGGVFVGYNTPGNSSASLTNTEVILKDPANNNLLVVTGLGRDYTKGQLIEVSGKVVLGTSTDKTRLGLSTTSSELVVRGSTSDDKVINLDLNEAIEINNQATVLDLFSDTNRDKQLGKLFKLDKTVAGNKSYDNIYRLFFPGVTANTSGETPQYVNKQLSPSLKVPSFELNTTLKAVDIFGSTKSYSASQCGKYIYVVYLGSSGAYYGDFVVLGDYCVVE